MVDFNNETTITTAPTDILKITILQRRYEALNAIEWYYVQLKQGGGVGLAKVFGPIKSFFKDNEQMLVRRMKPEAFQDLKDRMNSYNSIDDLEEIYNIIDDQLYEVGLIKIDFKKQLGGNIVARNKTQGWRA